MLNLLLASLLAGTLGYHIGWMRGFNECSRIWKDHDGKVTAIWQGLVDDLKRLIK